MAADILATRLLYLLLLCSPVTYTEPFGFLFPWGYLFIGFFHI